MRRRICSVGKTDIYVHPAFLLTAVYMVLTGFSGLMVATAVSILLHEIAHALTSASFGKPPQEIELTPLGALMRLEEDAALSPLKRMLTVLAGPGMTLLLCVGALEGTRHGLLSNAVGRLFFMCNLSILFVNLLPALPLDGGRLLAQGLSLFLRSSTTSRIMQVLGTLTGFGCIAVNLWMTWRYGGWNLSLTAAGCFLIYSAAVSTATQAMAQLRAFADRKIRLENHGTIRIHWLAVNDAITLSQAVRKLHSQRYTIYSVLETGTQRHLGFVHEPELIQAYLKTPSMQFSGFMREKSWE